jgi:hypothetical protein
MESTSWLVIEPSQNAYLNAKCLEKIWFKGGKECSEDAGKACIVVRVLYSLKSAGSSWHAELVSLLCVTILE